MEELVNELVYSIISEAPAPSVKRPATAKYPGAYGKWYSDPELKNYVGRVLKGKWVDAAGPETPSKKKPTKKDAGTPSVATPTKAAPATIETIPMPQNMETEAEVVSFVDALYELSKERLERSINMEFKKKNGTLNEKKIKNTIVTYLKNCSLEELDALRNNRENINFMTSIISASSRTFGNFVHLRNASRLKRKLQITGKDSPNALKKLKERTLRFYSPNQFDFIPMNTFENKKVHIKYFLDRTNSKRYWNKLTTTLGDFIVSRKDILEEFKQNEDAMNLINQIVSQGNEVTETTLASRRNAILEILFPKKKTEEFDVENLVRMISANTPMDDLTPSQFQKKLDLVTGQALVLASYRDEALDTALNTEPDDPKKLADRAFKKEALNEIYMGLNNYQNELMNISKEIQALDAEPNPQEYKKFQQRADAAYQKMFSFSGDDARKKAMLCGKILAVTAEAHEFYREIVGGEEAYLPEYGSFPCGDKLAVNRTTNDAGVTHVKVERRSVKSSVINKSAGAQSEFSQYPITEGIYGKEELGSLGWTHKQPFQFPRIYAEEYYETVLDDANARSIFASEDKVGEFRNLIVALQDAATGEMPDPKNPHHSYMEPLINKSGNFVKNPDGSTKYVHKSGDFPGDRSLRAYATAGDDRTKIYDQLKQSNPNLVFPEEDSFVGYMIETLRNIPETLRNDILTSGDILVNKTSKKKQTEVDIPNTMAKIMEKIVPYYFDTEEASRYFGQDNYREFMRRGPIYGFGTVLCGAVLNKHNGFQKDVTHAYYDLSLIDDSDDTTLKISKFTGKPEVSNWQVKLDLFQGIDGAWNLSTKYGGFASGLRITAKKGDPVIEDQENFEL